VSSATAAMEARALVCRKVYSRERSQEIMGLVKGNSENDVNDFFIFIYFWFHTESGR